MSSYSHSEQHDRIVSTLAQKLNKNICIRNNSYLYYHITVFFQKKYLWSTLLCYIIIKFFDTPGIQIQLYHEDCLDFESAQFDPVHDKDQTETKIHLDMFR